MILCIRNARRCRFNNDYAENDGQSNKCFLEYYFENNNGMKQNEFTNCKYYCSNF